MTDASPLSAFLKETRERYLKAVQDGSLHEWTVVMGNEAGDLDTIASSIAYSWLASAVKHLPTIAFLQTSREDLHLRAENQHALSLAGLTADQGELLCASDLPAFAQIPFPATRFALVDHNRLLTRFTQENPDARVVAVVDHHDDEGLYTDTAEPRTIAVPTGSCASLVAQHIQQSSAAPPPELATLLLSAILIDTNGLKVGGKATPTDRAAAAFLAPRSTLAAQGGEFDAHGADGADLHDAPLLRDLNAVLQDKKADVSHLATRDLLRRDYKEYAWAAHWAPTAPPLLVGLASVPVGLAPWLATRGAPAFWRETEAWAAERGLAALGVLTSFRDAEKETKKGKGKHRREQLWLLPAASAGAGADGLAERLWAGLEANAELELKRQDFAAIGAPAGNDVNGGFAEGWEARVYKQKNTDATRKVTAPVIRAIVENVNADT